MTTNIHQLALVHPEAKIGNNVTIDPFAVIHKDVVIGDNTWIGSHVIIYDGARIGKNCKIYPCAVLSAIPQDLKFEGEDTVTEIDDNTIIRECVTVNKGTKAAYKTVIGKSCLIMAYVHVAHDCIIGDHCIVANSTGLGGHVIMDDWSIIGGLSAVHQFVHIGQHAMISGGSLVRKDVPPYVKAGRNPIGFVGINSIGLRRRGFSNEKINEIQDIYRILYLRGLNNTQAIHYLEENMPSTKERDEIILFIRNSDRGIMRGYSE